MSAAAEMSIETPASFVFLPDQLKILQDNLTVVQSKKAKEKHKHIKSIRKQILELPVSKALPLEQREDLKIAINSWFSRRTRGGSHKIKFGKTWNGRLVMYDERRETVNQLKAELFDKAKTKSKAKGKDGPRNGFDYFQLALTHYWNELDDEEKDRYRTIAAKWNSEGVSKEKKREAASKQAISYIKRFAEDMYKSMGVRFLFLTALESPEGTIETGVMDFNDSIGGGTSYIAANPTWNMEGIDIESWNAHCRDYYNAEQGAPVHHKKLPRKHLMFEENEYGEPILPNPLEVPKRQNGRTWRQAVVRGFLSRHYELASGRSRAIPWKNFLPEVRECIAEEYLPEEQLEHFGEPSSMRDNHCYELLSFWYDRQQAGLSPTFRFRKYLGTRELFPAHERMLIPAKSTVEETTIEQQGIGDELVKSQLNGREEKGKGRAMEKQGVKGLQKGKRKGKQRVVEEDSAESSVRSSSSEEPILEDGSGDSDDELDWVAAYQEDGSHQNLQRSNTFGGESSMGSTSQAVKGHPAAIPASKQPEHSTAESSQSIGEAKGAEGIDLRVGLGAADDDSCNGVEEEIHLEPELQAIADILKTEPKVNVNTLLLKALTALRVHSRPPSPDKQLSEDRQHSPEKKRARSQSPVEPKGSPKKKARDLHSEQQTNIVAGPSSTSQLTSETISSFPPASIPDLPPSHTSAALGIQSTNSTKSRKPRYRGANDGAAVNSQQAQVGSSRVTRSQKKSEQRSLRRKV